MILTPCPYHTNTRSEEDDEAVVMVIVVNVAT